MDLQQQQAISHPTVGKLQFSSQPLRCVRRCCSTCLEPFGLSTISFSVPLFLIFVHAPDEVGKSLLVRYDIQYSYSSTCGQYDRYCTGTEL